MGAVAAPACETNPDMPDQIIDAVMARAIQADAVRTHPLRPGLLRGTRHVSC
jgi:hypothetical protein